MRRSRVATAVLAHSGVVLSLAPVLYAQPTIVEPGWYLAEEYALPNARSARHNPADGRIYAASYTTGSAAGVYVFDAAGDPIQLVTVDNPAGIAIDTDGNVFYTLDSPGTIERLPFGSSTPATWVSGFHAGDDDPIGLAIAPSNANLNWLAPGEALVADRGDGGPDEVWKWTPGTAEGETAVHSDDGTLVNPVDVAIGATRAYVADDVNAPGNGMIYEILPDGTLAPIPGLGIDRPVGVDVDPATQDLIVTDTALDRVVRINAKTGAVSDMFTNIPGPGYASVDVFDHGAAILISDGGADRVYLFRRERTTCLSAPFEVIEDSDPQASGRFGALVDTHDNLVLVADEADQRLRLFEIQPDGSSTLIFDHDAGAEIRAIALGDEHIAVAVYDNALDRTDVWLSPGGSSPPNTQDAPHPSQVPGDEPVSLASCGHEVFIGVPGDGRVRVIEFDLGTMVWDRKQDLLLPAMPPQVGGIAPSFGFAIDCDGDTFIVGAPGLDNEAFLVDAGRAYTYKRDPGTGDWALQQELTPVTPQDGAQFGYDVAVCGSVAVVGAPFADNTTSNVPKTGSIGRFSFDSQTQAWNQASVTPLNANAHFGTTVDISNDTLVVGAPDDTVSGNAMAGRTYIYNRIGPDAGLGSWDFITTYIGTSPGDRVGQSLALSKSNLLYFGLPDTDDTPGADVGIVFPVYLGDCPDCNADLLPDNIQIDAGLADIDLDDVPDACEPIENITFGSRHATIQEAIDRAVINDPLAGTPDTISVPSGTYNESLVIDRDLSIVGQSSPTPPLLVKPVGNSHAIFVYSDIDATLADFDIGDPATPTERAISVSSGATLVADRMVISGHTSGAVDLFPDSTATFSDCDFVRNSDVNGPAAIYAFGGAELDLARCRFVGNSSGTFGAAISALDAGLSIRDSLFLGNDTSATSGAAIAIAVDGTPIESQIVNSTFVANATSNGAGDVILASGDAPTTIVNTIFWGNDTTQPLADFDPNFDISYCLADVALTGTGNITGDPMFMESPDPGPDMMWGTGDDTGDPTPWIGSPAIDAGDSQAYLSATGEVALSATDLDGGSRAIDATNYTNTGDDLWGAIDIGALEAPADTPAETCPCPADLDGDCDTDVFDFGVFVNNFGNAGLPPFTGGDLDGDGDVDVFDFGVFAPDFGCVS